MSNLPRALPIHAPMQQFSVVNGQLQIGGLALERLAAQVGQTPFYAYDRKLLQARVAELRAALPASIKLHYAMKANPLTAGGGWMVGLILMIAGAVGLVVGLFQYTARRRVVHEVREVPPRAY